MGTWDPAFAGASGCWRFQYGEILRRCAPQNDIQIWGLAEGGEAVGGGDFDEVEGVVGEGVGEGGCELVEVWTRVAGAP